MKRLVCVCALLVGCATGDDADRAESQTRSRSVTLDSLTVTDSVGLTLGGSSRIRIAYWAEDRMIYCAMATLASVTGAQTPLITEETSCANVDLLIVDSVRFQNGFVTTPALLRQHTALEVQAKR